MTQYRMKELDSRFKVRIVSANKQGTVEKVEAPLPDQYGLTVGSEFSAPFDGNLVSGTLAKVAALGGMAKKVGTSGTKMYSNPEPSEISFDLEFEAYYSAKEEVLLPVALLMSMALGTHLDIASLDEKTKELISKVANTTGSSIDESYDSTDIVTDEEEQWGDRILELIGFIQGPRKVRIHFGKAFRLPSVWVSSVAPQFSNVLDPNGFPMSATVSVTCVLEKEPIVEDLNEWFIEAINQRVSTRAGTGRNELGEGNQ